MAELVDSSLTSRRFKTPVDSSARMSSSGRLVVLLNVAATGSHLGQFSSLTAAKPMRSEAPL